MPTILRLHRSTAGAVLAGAILVALGVASQGVAAPARGESFTGTAADLKRITGFPIEIHASSRMALDSSLPLICKTVVDAFQSAAADPETGDRLGNLVHVVVIQDWASVGEKYHVEVYHQVLTIQTLTDPSDVDTLRPLITGVLKKAARAAAKRGH